MFRPGQSARAEREDSLWGRGWSALGLEEKRGMRRGLPALFVVGSVGTVLSEGRMEADPLQPRAVGPWATRYDWNVPLDRRCQPVAREARPSTVCCFGAGRRGPSTSA